MSLDKENKQITVPLLQDRRFWMIVIIIVVMLGASWLLLSQAISQNYENRGQAIVQEAAPKPGYPAPEFELKNLEGEIVKLSDFKGKKVVVNFWATWCPPCRAEFPDFQEAVNENADDLVIIAINHTSSDEIEAVNEFVNEMEVTFHIVLDEDGSVLDTYGVLGLPTSIFIDEEGVVQEVFTGAVDKNYIESKLSDL